MLSMKMIENLSKYLLKTLFIKHIKVAGAFVSPNDITRNCYGEKFLWLGVPQQTNLIPEINLSQYAIEIKFLTLKDQTSYLISDG